MNNSISKYIQIFDKRIFVDVASKGCGSGCVYCFSKYPSHMQELLSVKDISDICDKIMDLPECNESIISLCPNTEPMKSEESRRLTKVIVERLASKVKFIQIATKEKIPMQFLSFLNENAQYSGQIRISISLPYLNNVDNIEPGAAEIANRLDNFNNIKRFPNLISVLYLRPFNRQMLLNKEEYINIINTYKPDDICLGAEFVPRVDGEQLCTYMYNKQLAPEIFQNVDKADIFRFADYLRKGTDCEVFYSSICNITNCSDYGCKLKLYEYDQAYCKDCILHKSL